MKKWLIIPVILLVMFQSCGYKEKEEQLARRERQISDREQMLMQWEQRLIVQEQELEDKKKQFAQDTTTVTDSTTAAPIAGKWTVKMRCTETSCSGSAIGDTKTETWEITHASNGIVVNAFTGAELSRIYNGSFMQDKLAASSGQQGAESLMKVSLELRGNKMEGLRDVERAGCKIRYTLTAERQK